MEIPVKVPKSVKIARFWFGPVLFESPYLDFGMTYEIDIFQVSLKLPILTYNEEKIIKS